MYIWSSFVGNLGHSTRGAAELVPIPQKIFFFCSSSCCGDLLYTLTSFLYPIAPLFCSLYPFTAGLAVKISRCSRTQTWSFRQFFPWILQVSTNLFLSNPLSAFFFSLPLCCTLILYESDLYVHLVIQVCQSLP